MHSDTIFSSLPASLQLRIFEDLKWSDCRNARLVCADWYELINHLKPPKFTLIDDAKVPVYLRSRYTGADRVLPCLINSYFEKIGTLVVKDLWTPLPIISSTRMSIPRANKLVLREGISEQNILKLLRYYTRSVDVLFLEDFCLVPMKPWLLTQTLAWNQMRRLEIDINFISKYYDATRSLQEDTDTCMHFGNLGKLFASIRIPNLSHFEFRMTHYCRVNPVTSGVDEMSLVNPLKKLGAGLEKFLSIHGPGLVHVSLRFPCTEMLSSWCKLMAAGRLKSLFLSLTHDADLYHVGQFETMYGRRTDPRLAFGCFKNLVRLRLHQRPARVEEEDEDEHDPHEHEKAYHEVTALILANNKQTLRSFSYECEYGYHFETFSWLIPDLKLKELKLQNFTFSDRIPDSPRLEHVTELSVVHVKDIDDYDDRDWSTPAFAWISKTMPALQKLFIAPCSHAPVGLATRGLIENVTSLRQVTVEFWPRHWRCFNGLSPKVMKWITSTQGRVEWSMKHTDYSNPPGWYSHKIEYKILIHRD